MSSDRRLLPILTLAALGAAMSKPASGPSRGRWKAPKNYGNKKKRLKAEKANKAARKSRRRNRRKSK